MIENIFNGSALEKQLILSLSPSQGRSVITNWAIGQLLEGKVEEVLTEQQFLINFKGIKIVAESSVPLNAGQSIQARVAQSSPQMILNLVVEGKEEPNTFAFERSRLPSATHGEELTEKRGEIFSGKKLSANCTVGQLLKGKVEEALGEKRFLINFKGFKIVTESTVPLNAGQSIQVKVTQTSPQVIFNLVVEGAEEQKALALIRSHLPSSTSLADLVEKLGKIFTGEKLYQLEVALDKTVLEKVMSSLSSLSVNKDVAGNPENLKQLIDRSGLYYEAKWKDVLLSNTVLAKNTNALVEKDLKALLLRLSQDLEQIPGVMNKGESDQVNQALHNLLEVVNASIEKIETNQLVNYLTSKNDQQVVLQIPVVLPEGIKTAELYVHTNSRRKKKEKLSDDDCHIVFLLTMRNLGHLRIDTRVTDKNIGCTIQVDNREIADFVKRNLPELSRRLSGLDFSVEKLSCIIKKSDSERIAPLEGFSLLEMRLVDIVA